jgi:hypothetical protein
LVEQPTVNKERSLKFGIGARIPTVSSKVGQHLKPSQILTIKGPSGGLS